METRDVHVTVEKGVCEYVVHKFILQVEVWIFAKNDERVDVCNIYCTCTCISINVKTCFAFCPFIKRILYNARLLVGDFSIQT